MKTGTINVKRAEDALWDAHCNREAGYLLFRFSSLTFDSPVVHQRKCSFDRARKSMPGGLQ